MSIKSINQLNRECLSAMEKSKPHISFDWNDSFLWDLLLFRFPTIVQRYDDPKPLSDEIQSISGLLNNYKFGKIRRDEFLVLTKFHFDAIARMKDIRPLYPDGDYYPKLVSLQSRMILHGPGGMGKSEFLYEISKEMDEKEIAHLTLYGKFIKKVSEIPFGEIEKKAVSSRFVFIFDAINEMAEGQAALLLTRLKKIKDNGNLFLLVSYRDGYFSENSAWLSSGFYDYVFEGVNYQAAVSSLIAHNPQMFFAYSDLLESNNALILNALLKTIDKPQKARGKMGSIASITTLLEHLVRQETEGGWNLVKAMANQMGNNGQKFLSQNEINSLVYPSEQEKRQQLDRLLSDGFVICFSYAGEKQYAFGVERLTDFLLARNLLQIEPWDSNVVREKARALRLSPEILPLVIWDKCKGELRAFLRAIMEIDPSFSLSFSLIKLMKWDIAGIQELQANSKPSNLRECFVELAGVKDKPFNCFNYLDGFFLANPQEYLKLVKSFYIGMDVILELRKRLRNTLANIDAIGMFYPQMEEGFLFAFWCLGFGDRQCVLLAQKILLEVSTFDHRHVTDLIQRHGVVQNVFIREKIIDVLTHLDHSLSPIITPFFLNLLSSEDFLHAENEARIYRYLGKKLPSPDAKKFDVIEKVKIEEPLPSLVKTVQMSSAMIDRYFLRVDFQFDDKKSSEFLDYPISVVAKANRDLKKLNPCYNANGCRLFGTSELDEGKKVGIDAYHRMNNRYILLAIAYYYSIISKEYEPNINERSFDRASSGDSFLARCLLLAQNQAYGSIMHHFYSNKFYEGSEDGRFRGFTPFNPLEFEADDENLWGISALFDPCASFARETLENRICSGGWNGSVNQMNRKREKEEIEKVILPISIPDYRDTFIPFSILFRHGGESKYSYNGSSEWSEDCSFYGTYLGNRTIHGLRNDRSLSIELPDYWGSIRDYGSKQKCGSKCLSMPSLNGRRMNLPSASVILPPASVVRKLSLEFHVEDGTWRRGKEVVFISDDGGGSYYTNTVSQCLLISRKAYQELLGDKTLSFFGYFERFTPLKSKAIRSDFHFQVKKGKIQKMTSNTNRDPREKPRSSFCFHCPRYLDSLKPFAKVLPQSLAQIFEKYQGSGK